MRGVDEAVACTDRADVVLPQSYVGKVVSALLEPSVTDLVGGRVSGCLESLLQTANGDMVPGGNQCGVESDVVEISFDEGLRSLQEGWLLWGGAGRDL